MDTTQWQIEMEKTQEETHRMVEEMYNIIVGGDNYKEASIIFRMKAVEFQLEKLENDKLIRDTSLKNARLFIGLLCTVLGSLITVIISHYIK
jgi:hypothetical protein